MIQHQFLKVFAVSQSQTFLTEFIDFIINCCYKRLEVIISKQHVCLQIDKSLSLKKSLGYQKE